MKYIIGLTGGIGSGKTTVTQQFSELGIDIVDADEVSRDLLKAKSSTLEIVTRHFGQQILDQNGKLDRAKLRKIIFSNLSEKTWLENLLHPLIRQEIDRLIEASTSSYVILSAPLLLENEQYNFVDRVLVVDTPIELQLARVTQRDQTSNEATLKIINAQLSREDRLARADDVIINDSNIAHLQQQVLKLHDYYQQQIHNHSS